MSSADLQTTKRQKVLAKYIGQNYCKTDRLIPHGAHGCLSVPPMPLRLEIWAAERLCDIAWWVVADRFGRIDHAWVFGLPDAPREPWGFVTEPYSDPETAMNVVRAASEAMPEHEWGIQFYALGPGQGSWNPPRCIPIVAVSQDYSRLICKTIPRALGIKTKGETDV